MGSSQQFSLRWNNYLHHITSAFDSLRSDLDLVDVTLSCEGKKIKAHKMLLSACSTYFKDLFKENPCQHPVIVFRNVSFADLEALIDFMYQGEVNVVQEQLASFLTTAELLAVQGLTDGAAKDINECQEEASTDLVTEENALSDKKRSSSTNNYFASASQRPTSPPAKRKKWSAAASVSSSQKSRSDSVENKNSNPSTSNSGSNQVNIMPVLSQVKVELPDFVDSESGELRFNSANEEVNLDELSGVEQNSQSIASGKEESLDIYGANSNDTGEQSAEQMTQAELCQVLSKAGPSSEGSQDSLQAPALACFVHPSIVAAHARPPRRQDPGGGGRRVPGADHPDLDGGLVLVGGEAGEGAAPGRHVCHECGKHFAHPMSLVQHRRIHSGSTTCPVCRKVLNRVHDLKIHMALKHGPAAPPTWDRAKRYAARAALGYPGPIC